MPADNLRGQRRPLAWDLDADGAGLLTIFLYQTEEDAYFLEYRALGRRPTPRLIVPVSAARAAAWFSAHPGRFVAPNDFAA